MIARLGDFEFKYTNFPLQSVSESIDAGFTKVDRINNTQAIISLKRESTELEITAELLMTNSKGIDEVKKMLKSKKPYSLILQTGVVLGKFVIAKMSISYSSFLGKGSRIKSINISLWKVS